MRLYVIARHGESTLNFERRVNGDPDVPADLTERGREEARLLGEQIEHLPLDACVHTRFSRTRQTAERALEGRRISVEVEPLLDDIRVGQLEGASIEDYRAWKRMHTRRDPFPGGESLDDAALRYAEAYRRLLAKSYERVLVVCHEIPLRYALNAAAGSDELDGPAHELRNATPYLFSEQALKRAVAVIDRLAAPRKGLAS